MGPGGGGGDQHLWGAGRALKLFLFYKAELFACVFNYSQGICCVIDDAQAAIGGCLFDFKLVLWRARKK